MLGPFPRSATAIVTIALTIAILTPATRAASQANAAVPERASAAPEDVAPSMRFDVVSIKPDNGDAESIVNLQRNTDFVFLKNMSLSSIIEFAYRFHRPDLVLGLPAWAKTDRYDITAKVSVSDATEYQKMTNTQHRLMLQTLIADSFNLKIHKDTREIPVYELVVSKRGSKLANGGHTGPNIAIAKAGHLEVQGILMANLADYLTEFNIGRPVVDRTGLPERYDFKLLWLPDVGTSTMNPGISGDDQTSPESSGQSIFSAVRDQLGLELRPAKAPAECLVVDRAERPTFD